MILRSLAYNNNHDVFGTGTNTGNKPVLHLHSLHAVQVQDGQDDGHEEDDNTADAHTYIEHLSGAGGGGHTIY